jgi:hypothetical protein
MPHVPPRQCVLIVPVGLRFAMAFDPALAGLALRTFVRRQRDEERDARPAPRARFRMGGVPPEEWAPAELQLPPPAKGPLVPHMRSNGTHAA